MVARRIEATLGVRLLYSSSFRRFYDNSETRDVLDSVTIVYNYLKQAGDDFRAQTWRSGVSKILLEEHLSYKIDDLGIVRPFIDPEFDANRASAIEALSEPRFREAQSDFQAAFQHLRDNNGKEALRMMFPAVETAAKVLFPGAFSRLMPNEVDKHLKRLVLERYAGNQPAIDAGRLLLDGMKNWINASQPYRHGQEQQEPAEPPADFVVAHLSAGATYLRVDD